MSLYPGADGLTRAIARRSSLTVFDALPAAVREVAHHALLDFLGVCLAGSREHLTLALLAEMQEMGGAAQSAVLGHAQRLPALNAALVNGSAAHAHDYDDANMSFGGHTSAVLFPTVLALGEKLGSSGREVMTAYAAGYQTGCSVGALMPGSLDRGFHPTGTVGVFAAAAASAHLMKFDADMTATALGIAAAQSAGLRADGGTMCKPLHAGKAAQSGMLAAFLARRGFTSRTDILECPKGFVEFYGDNHPASAAAAMDPGRFFLLENIFKYHASCFFTHAAVECALKLNQQSPVPAAQVKALTVAVHPKTLLACRYLQPVDGLQSKRSFPFGVAVVLAGRDTADLATFSDAAVADPAIEAIRAKVRVTTDETLTETGAHLTLETSDGLTLSAAHDALQTQVPDLAAALHKKFSLLASPVKGALQAARLAALAGRVLELEDISALMDCTRA